MAFKKARLISRFISKGSFKLSQISKKIFKLNQILKREKPLKGHKKTKSIKKLSNRNKSFLKASVLLIGALGGLSHLRANECRYWSWSSWGYQDNIESGPNSPTHNSYCLFSSAQGSGTYYLNTLTTYSAGGASFTQKFNNGTLNVGGNIRFGGTGINGGDVGYITGTYDAANIYLTSHLKTGNSYADGGGATLNFNAANNITINQASFDNSHAGTQKSYMNFKGSNIKVSGSSFTDDTNGGFSFSGSSNNSAISFDKTSFNQGTYHFNSTQSVFNNSSFNQGTYDFNSAQSTFENSTFNQGTYDFNDNVSFNNNTFNQGTYNFNTSKVSFSGTNTLNSSSPFANLKGSVSFNSNAIFNLNQTLNNNQTYDILTTNGAIQYGVYQSYLWDLINYKGDKAISHVEVGNNTYDVTFDINGQDETLQETFNNQSIITQFLGDNLQQQAQKTYQQDLSNSQSALNNAASDNKIASNDTSYTQSKNATIAKDAQGLENTNQKIAQDEQALEKDLAQIKQLANSTTGFNEQAFNQAQKQEQQDEQTLQNEEKTFNTEQEGLKQAIQQAQAQEQEQEQQQAQKTYQQDLSNSQSALNNAASDNKIASNDTSYTQSKNATIAKDAQGLENTNQKIAQDEQALEKDLAQIKQLANSTTGFNEQAFNQAQKQEQQDEQTLQNEEKTFNTEQEGLKQAIQQAQAQEQEQEQQQAQKTYQQDLSNSQSALNNAASDNKIASNDTSYTQSKNATIAKDAQGLENTNQKIAQDEQALEKDLAQIKQLANSTTGFNEQAFNQAQKQEQQDEQTLQNEEKTFNTEQEGLKQAIQQAQAQEQEQEQQQAQKTYQQDLSNSQSALNNAASDNKIASNDTSYTQSKNATIAKDAQGLENTNQKIAQDEQALEKDLAQIKQLANSTTGFNEQAFNQAQKQEQQDEQTLQNEEKTFNTEQEGLEQAIANAKHANPTPNPTPSPTKHTAPNTPPSQVPPTPTQNLPKTNVWSEVYWLQNQTYSKQGIYYIDPNLSGQSGQSGNTLSTYTANLFGRSFGVNIQNGTLIIGNDTESVNDNGLIWIGHGGFGYITGTFNAANIYLTNNFKTGEGVSNSDGGGANITFKASDNITMDGLNYNDAETVTKMIQTGASQHSYATFDALNNISVTNSSFSDMTWGKFSFSAKNISFSNASFSGFTNPGGSSTISANASNSLSFVNSRLNGGAIYNLQANSLIFNNTQAVFNVLYSRGTSNFNATTQLLGNTNFTLSSQSLLNFNGDTTLQNNANITLGNKSQAAFKNSLTLDNNSNLSLDNQSVLNANNTSTFNNQASLNIYNGSQATFNSLFFNGGTLSLNASSKLNASNASFSNNTTINLDDSVLSANNTSSLNANINFQGASQADFGGNTTIDTASFNFDSASSLSFNNLTANGALNFNGYAPSLTKALMSVSGQFVLGNNGDINLSDINIFDNITKSVTYNILNAQKGITGISGANGYEKILFYGMKIQNATYSDNNNIQTWSFINSLNSSQIIQESIKNGDLTIEVLNNPNSASNTIFNIAPELYNYQASKQNPTGYSYDYSDNQAGTYYLTSNIKGLFTPKGSQTPQAPGTYSPFNQPLNSLNIYNKGFSSENLKTLLGILSQNSTTLKEMIESNQLDNITNINEVLQLLDKIKITQTQKQALLETINHLTDNINQTFSNGNLVIGATQDNVTNSTSSIWFGGNGYSSPCALDSTTCSSFRNTYLGQLLGSTSPYLGYINADFKAKSIYITGTLGSGNAFESGGSADVTFQSANNLVLNKANIEAQATDNIFNLLGQKGINEIFNQGNLANVLSQVAMEKIKQAGGLGNFIENALSPLSKELPASLQNETLGQLIGQNNLDDLLNNSGVMNAIQNIISKKLSIFGNFVTPSIIENYLAKQSLKSMLDDKGLLNFIGGYIDASELSSILSVVLKDITNPPTSLQKDIGVVANDLLNEFLGQDVVKKLESQGLVNNIINNIISQGGLSGVYNQGLGSVLPPSLQNALKENDLGALLSPRGLHDFWQKGYFNFLSNGYVFVNNSSFSNATGGSLNFVANKSIIFNGDNTIDFSKYQGALIFASNGVSNINITTLNATNGLSLNAGLNNVSVQKGEICINLANCPTTKNSSSTNSSVTPTNESLSVRANNFTFLGAITSNGVIDLSQVKNNSVIGTLNLNENATLQANNLTITNAFNNASNSTANINGNFTLNQQATLSTNASGLNVMGNFNSYGDLVFNLSHSVSHAIINAQGSATIMANNNNPLIQFNTSSKEVGTYTLIDSAKAIYYGYNDQITGGSSLDNYLKLYTLIDINGKHMVMTDNGLTYNGQAVSIKDGGLVIGFKDSQNQYIYTSILYNKVKIAVSNDPINNLQAPTLKQYIAQIQGVQSVDSIDQVGGNQAINWLNKIFETKGSPLFAPYYLESHSTKDLTTIAGDIANTLEVIANPDFKNDATNILQINTYTQQMSRLAKLSDTSTFARSDFLERLEALKNKRFADAIPNAMDVILKYSQRNRVKNNVWATGVGGASFINGGTGTLYGINVGYDRFIKGVIVGGYAAYGYSGFHGNITQSGSSNVNIGVYSRAFIKRSELTISLNETWGYNKTFINSYDPLLSIINQSYRYDTWTTDAKINYGYDFMFKDKSVIFKPQVGLAYYYIGLSSLRGIMDDPIYNQFRANADPNKKSVLTINFALESRHYFNKNSYYFVIADVGRDLFINSMGDKMVRFIGNNTLSYRDGGRYNTFASIITGGEIRLFKTFYVNAGIGARFGLDYKDINITGNIGMRYAF
ncbi:toxin [Helicobacter pylori]|uniref:vacuolating cytotoxin domain-containing protein n=2 Tax=Helicobacter pylori TaxID=210 RepID=UPI000FDDC002|nr:vacuolating cytotoxin domain-containing protein [Helicobacter pylori]RVZ59172.1 toxin [Helicobacter pylori]